MRAPSGVITLLTDFGTHDPFVGIMKGVILGRAPSVRVVDLTHDIAPQDLAAASFWLRGSFRWFPSGTVHLVVVDPGVGTPRAEIVAAIDDHFFVAPDNGLLSPLLQGARGSVRLHRLDRAALGLGAVSATFQGRDVFAPAAAALASGRATLDVLGPEVTAIAPGRLPEPRVEGGRVEGEVITADRFGNAITNLDAAWIRRFTRPRVTCLGRTLPFGSTYAEVAPGETLALINAFDVLEIACRDGSATSVLSLEKGVKVSVEEGPAPGSA